MPRVPEILVFSGPGLSVSVTDRASTGGPPARPGLPLAGHVRASVSRLVRVHSSGQVSGLGTRSVCVWGEVVTHRCCSVRRRLRPRPLPEQPVLVQGHAESPAELPPPLSRPPVRGLSDGFGAAEGAGLWFPGSQVKAACRGPEVPLFVVPSPGPRPPRAGSGPPGR